MTTPLPKYYIVLFTLSVLVGGFFAWTKIPTQVNPINQVEHRPKQTTLIFGGDIMLSRNVAREIYKAKDNELPFRNIAPEFSKADIAFANLESPFLSEPPFAQQGLVFKADPQTIAGLKLAGFDILSTANNHSFDQGRTGIDFTYDYLGTHGITPVGTGPNCHEGVIITKNNIRFGFLAYSYAAHNDGGKIPDPLVCDWNNQAQVTTDIANLRSKVDFLIVSAHMGTEYMREPDTFNAEGAENAIESGADFVIGHHPHWIQTIKHHVVELPYTQNGNSKLDKREGWIFHSLGNLVFDQMWSQDTREGLVVQVQFSDKSLEKIELKPVIIENFCCPRWADELETKNILKKINPATNSRIIFDKGEVTDGWKNSATN